MGFSFTAKKEQELQTVQEPQLQLTQSEVEAILTMIKDSSFKGEQIEYVYNLVYKLQEYYKLLIS
jgi:hypothetical protein